MSYNNYKIPDHLNSEIDTNKVGKLYPEKLSLKFIGLFYILLFLCILLSAYLKNRTLDDIFLLIVFIFHIISVVISIMCMITPAYKKTIYEYIALFLALLPVILIIFISIYFTSITDFYFNVLQIGDLPKWQYL